MILETMKSKCSASKCGEEDDVEIARTLPRTSKFALSSVLGNQRQDQLIDALTSQISLYHSRSKSSPLSKTTSDRYSVLKWFSSLTVHQRQSHLTVVDYKQVQILTRMMSKLRSHGCGGFIVLPDILEHNIPSLCYKRFTGLLSRVVEADEAEKILVRSVWMFGSREGENINDSSSFLASLDSITLADDLVEDVDKFFEIMDSISGGYFLRGEGDDLSSDWVELEWLKGRGYYTIGAFIGNMVEVCLRLAWQNKSGGRKKGVKLKEKFATSGVAGNLFWRKKGCLDWWQGLPEDTKRKLIRITIGKGSSYLVNEVFKEYKNKGLIQLMDSKGVEPSIGSAYGELKEKLLVLQSVIEIFSLDWGCKLQTRRLFFSYLGNVYSVRDCLLRKLRGLLMFISLDCMKLELFSQADSGVPFQKSVTTDRKKNGKAQINRKSKVKKKDPNNKFDSNSHQRNDVTLPTPSSTCSMELQSMKAGKEKGSKHKKGKCKNSKASKCASNVPKAEMSMEERAKCTSSENLVFGGELESPKNACISSKELAVDYLSSPSTAVCLLVNENIGKVAPCIPDNVSGSLKHGFGREEEKFPGVEAPNNELHIEEKFSSSKCSNEKMCDDATASPTSCLSFEHHNSTSGYHQLQKSNTIAAADRLHLDVGLNSHVNVRQPLVQTVCSIRRPRVESNCTHLLPRTLPLSIDWPPVVRNFSGFPPSWTYNNDSEFIPYRNPRFQKILSNGNSNEDHGEAVNLAEKMKRHEIVEDCDVHWVSEDDIERHAVSGMDYNQYFGGGVMYWDPSDQPTSSYSRPPSLSSDDSLWAWHEADVNRTVDDMVTFPSSFSTNGLNSPRSNSFCSPFDPQALSYAMPSNDISSDTILDDDKKSLSGKIETRTSDSAYPILRPIIIPSMSKRSHDPRSPCISSRRQEQSRIKRPPSPVVLCVPRARRPPPPSPVKDARNQRKFPTVRSGSSSPRHWGVRCWYQEGITLDETCVRLDVPEVVLPSWRNKTLSKHAIIPPIAGPLFHDLRFPISHLSRDQEHPDVSLPLQLPSVEAGSTLRASLSLTQSILHDEIDHFCRQVATANAIRKPFINWAVKRVSRSLQVLWPRSRTSVYGSNVTGLSLPTSDVDLVVCLPPVRNLEPIKEAGILEGRNGIKETCLQHAARYLANQEWVKSDSLRTVENTAIPLIMLVVEVPGDLGAHGSNMQPQEEESCKSFEQDDDDSVTQNICPAGDSVNDVKYIRLDISFKSPTHTGLQTSELVKSLTEIFPAIIPLALVLKQFLADRNLERSYSGGLSSYCVVLLVTRFLQHEHHLGRVVDKNLGCLLMEFLYFFGNVFDPRQMRISIQGSGIYIKRARECSIDPLYIDDPLFPTNNVGRNCFRIHQCIKAFAEAYCTLASESVNYDASTRPRYWLLPKIVPSVSLDENLTLNTKD